MQVRMQRGGRLPLTAGRRVAGAVCICLSLGLASCVPNYTPWPTFQATLKPGRARTPTVATLPADIAIHDPDPATPAAVKGLSGQWQGWMGAKRAISVAVAVEDLSARAGSIYLVTSQDSGRIAVTVRGDELYGASGGEYVAIRLRPDGNMDVYRKVGQDWSSGVLSKM